MPRGRRLRREVVDRRGYTHSKARYVTYSDPDTGLPYLTVDTERGVVIIQTRHRGKTQMQSVSVAKLAGELGCVLVPAQYLKIMLPEGETLDEVDPAETDATTVTVEVEEAAQHENYIEEVA